MKLDHKYFLLCVHTHLWTHTNLTRSIWNLTELFGNVGKSGSDHQKLDFRRHTMHSRDTQQTINSDLIRRRINKGKIYLYLICLGKKRVVSDRFITWTPHKSQANRSQSGDWHLFSACWNTSKYYCLLSLFPVSCNMVSCSWVPIGTLKYMLHIFIPRSFWQTCLWFLF